MKQYHCKAHDREGWGEGPWLTEPDKIQWVDPETDLDCLMVRNQMGVWCGYVGVTEGHPLFGKAYQDITGLNVHGGLTFSDLCQESSDPSTGVCHIPEEGRSGHVWWLGFDCGHALDYIPGFAAFWGKTNVYKDQDYVKGQVEQLAKQVKNYDKEKQA